MSCLLLFDGVQKQTKVKFLRLDLRSQAFYMSNAGVLTLLREKDTAYGLTLLWSLVAVYEKHKNLQAMKLVSLAGIVALIVAASLSVLQRRRQTSYSSLDRSSVEEPLQA